MQLLWKMEVGHRNRKAELYSRLDRTLFMAKLQEIEALRLDSLDI